MVYSPPIYGAKGTYSFDVWFDYGIFPETYERSTERFSDDFWVLGENNIVRYKHFGFASFGELSRGLESTQVLRLRWDSPHEEVQNLWR